MAIVDLIRLSVMLLAGMTIVLAGIEAVDHFRFWRCGYHRALGIFLIRLGIVIGSCSVAFGISQRFGDSTLSPATAGLFIAYLACVPGLIVILGDDANRRSKKED